MLSLLDSIIDNMGNQVAAVVPNSGAPVVLYENHAAAAKDGCASLDTTHGKVSLMTAGSAARKARWHKFGVDIQDATDRRTAQEMGRLGWTVSKRPTFYRDNAGELRESLTTWAIVRDDTDEQLHTVGCDYTPIQNSDAFDFLDSLLPEFGARYETAGALRGGRQTFMQIQLPQGFEVVRGDGVQSVVTFTNSHAGEKAYCYPTTQRIVCANTFAIAQDSKDKGLAMKHTGNVKAKIGAARAALAKSIQGFAKFQEQAAVMVRTKITTQRAAIEVFDGILDVVLDITAAERLKGSDALAAALMLSDAKERERAAKSFQYKIEQRGDILNDILNRYESRNNRVEGIQGTGWAAFNAVTEHTNHSTIGRQVGTEDDRAARRFDSVMNGDAAEFNHAALEKVLALAN